LQALTLLAKISGMLITQQEISGPGGRPVEVDHTIDHSARICTRLDAIAARLPAPTEQPIIDARSDHSRVRGNRPDHIRLSPLAEPRWGSNKRN
jgi:hypothetical protein